MVARYNPEGYSVGMKAEGTGRYVGHSDYTKLEAENKRLREALERLIKHVEVIYNYKDAIVLGDINSVGSVRAAQEAIAKARGNEGV